MPILQKFLAAYKVWQTYPRHFPKDLRYSLGGKIDSLFTEILEAIFVASYLPKEQKLPYLKKAVTKLDLLKFFVRVAWESRALDNAKFIVLSEPLEEIGKMLGGWLKQIILINRNPAGRGE